MEPKPKKQRLAVFLDGTWNTQDDSTNVRHAYTLTKEGEVRDPDGTVVIQKRYYDPGVGTGMLDSVTGGGFGLGLEANVREAYNWLVDNYNDNEEHEGLGPDEVYIFGFSRGAYTARSLMGFISSCGLIKRGSPLMISQLWQSYIYIAQHRKEGNPWWKKALNKKGNKYKFRRIDKLRKDGDPEDYFNEAEQILKIWSRRINITYMGIFDTVGAMGWEALGIPGISSKLDQHHNPYPSRILQNCRHALAIDENRTSFRLTPMLNWVHHKSSINRMHTWVHQKKESGDNHKTYEIISQRWFVGAHSNNGGGYEDNLLAAKPLHWILEGARNIKGKKNNGLQLLDVPDLGMVPEDIHIRDSYAEFSPPFWVHIIRAKRHFRPINRPDDIRGFFSLLPINEKVDESVFELARSCKNYAPPNLITYAKQSDDESIKEIFKDRVPKEEWPGGNTLKARVILICWCTLAAVGFGAWAQLFLENYPAVQWIGFPIIAALLAFIDWKEAKTNLKSAMNPKATVARVIRNILLWLRLIGMLAFFTGAVAFLTKFIKIGWYSSFWVDSVIEPMSPWYLVPLAAAGMMLLLSALGKKDRLKNLGFTLLAAIISLVALVGIGIIISLAAGFLEHMIIGANDVEDSKIIPLTGTEILAGKILLMQLAMFVLMLAFQWVGKPMSELRSDLGSIVRLQFAFSKNRVVDLFEQWSRKLCRHWAGEDKLTHLGWNNVQAVLRESLWRDLIGFTPIYTIVFGTIMWIGSTVPGPNFWSFLYESSFVPGVQWWVLLIAVTAIADYIENTIHLNHIRNYTKDKISSVLTGFGFLATLIKFAGFIPSFFLSLGIFATLSWRILDKGDGGWRWVIASCVTWIIVLVVLPVLGQIAKSVFVKSKSD